MIEAMLGVFDDVIADPDRDCPSKAGRLYGVPILLKDLGSGLAGRTQEAGSLLSRDDVAPATDLLVANYLEAGLPEQAFLTEKLKHLRVNPGRVGALGSAR